MFLPDAGERRLLGANERAAAAAAAAARRPQKQRELRREESRNHRSTRAPFLNKHTDATIRPSHPS